MKPGICRSASRDACTLDVPFIRFHFAPLISPGHVIQSPFVPHLAGQRTPSLTRRDWCQVIASCTQAFLPFSFFPPQKGSWGGGGADYAHRSNGRAAKGRILFVCWGLGSLRLLSEHLRRLSWAAVLHSIKRDPPAPHVSELVLPLSPADSCRHPAAQRRRPFFLFFFYECVKLRLHFILAFFFSGLQT